MTDEERIECARITPEQAKANSEAILAMYEDGDRRDRMMTRYVCLAIERGQYEELKDMVTYGAVLDMFFGAPADQLDGLMCLSPNEIANRRKLL